MIHDKRYMRNDQVHSLKACTIYHVTCMIFHIEQLIFILFLTNVYFYTLASKCCCASVATSRLSPAPLSGS